jgi:phage/plasmid-associated DNA primase
MPDLNDEQKQEQEQKNFLQRVLGYRITTAGDISFTYVGVQGRNGKTKIQNTINSILKV